MTPDSRFRAFRLFLSGSLILLACLCQFATAATSVSQFGITWSWSEDRTVGQFANGDWWVVGPITLTSITRPSGGGDRDGTMINPAITNPTAANGYKYTQGWDNRIDDTTYDSTKNIAKSLPYSVLAGSSIVSAKSLATPLKQGGAEVALDTIAILTVLQSAPAAGSFRPTYYGTNKAIKWNKSQINYSKLRSVPPVAGMPSLATAETYYDHPYIVLGGEYFANLHAPVNNLPIYLEGNASAVGAYGREYQAAAQGAGLVLNLNYTNAQKEKLAIGMIQFGLDVYEAATRGCYWEPNGGWQQGRKLPLIIAGHLLGDANIMTVAGNKGAYQDVFQEDAQHFYVLQSDINTARCPILNRPTAPFTQAMLGMAEWGERYSETPCSAGSNFDLFYRDVNGNYGFGVFVTLHLMDLLDEWGDPPFGDYFKNRWYGTWGGSSSPQYVKDLWEAYSDEIPAPPAADVIAPSVPGSLQAVAVGSSNINLSWTASSDNVAVTGYRIYRNGAQVGTASGLTYGDSGLSPNTSYSYRVAAEDAAGNVSAQSNTATAVTGSVPSGGTALSGSAQQWEYLEWSFTNASYSGNPFDLLATATFTHSTSGETRTTEFFYVGSNTWKVRFTGTQLGIWSASSSSTDPELGGLSGTITVLANSNPAATGFLVNQGNKVAIQTKDGIKGYVLHLFTDDHDFATCGDDPGYSLIRWKGQETALARAYCDQSITHGFDSIFLHLNNEWLKLGANRYNQHSSTDPDLESFQIIDLVLDEARRKGCQVYIWAWGDEARKWTPIGVSGGINGTVDRRLQRYIAARLGPRPNWLMGYGFDLEEWVTNAQIASWASYLKARMGWPHLLDARNRPNSETTLISYNGLNHTYAEAVANLDSDPTRPHFFNEQDSYLRNSTTTMDWTRQHLWRYTLAGGHGGYWGRDEETGQNYPNPEQIIAFRSFWNDRFLLDFARASGITDGYALKTPDNQHYVFYKENSTSVSMNLSGMSGAQPAVAVDTKKAYAEVSLGNLTATNQTWTAPYASDWAIAVGGFNVAPPPSGTIPSPPTGLRVQP